MEAGEGALESGFPLAPEADTGTEAVRVIGAGILTTVEGLFPWQLRLLFILRRRPHLRPWSMPRLLWFTPPPPWSLTRLRLWCMHRLR